MGIQSEIKILIKDKDFTEIDDDVLEFFCKSKEEPYFRIFLNSDPISETLAPLDIFSDSSIKAICDNDIFDGTNSSTSTLSISSRMENISDVDDLQTQIIRGGGQYIIDQYQKNKMLTDRSRIHLVNIVADVLYEKYGSAVPKSAKMECAKKLVEIFPMYKNLESSTGG
ncbi:uncharacterized protein [Leptinotarsa decemlineata]|uniref:uncharacterized protein n=1 Tax=Leptinotarsa decemlineata TaxID=7539 RepID=UPI003D30ADCB